MTKKRVRYSVLIVIILIGVSVCMFGKAIVIRILRSSIDHTTVVSKGFVSLFPEWESFISPRQPHLQEIQNLMGKNKRKNIIIALMNSAERKPNGGFFGSYIHITLEPTNFLWTLQDSYEPRLSEKHSTPTPDRFRDVIDLDEIKFLGGNRRGFTDQDGKHLTDLFEKNHQTQLDGIIFINSDLWEYLDHKWKTKRNEGSFISTRQLSQSLGEKGSYKEKTYEKIRDSIDRNTLREMTKKGITHRDIIKNNHRIQVYVPKISPELQNTLIENNLVTIHNPDMLYLRDYNFGTNKIDQFVSKSRSLQNIQTNESWSGSGDRINTAPIKSGSYILTLTYDMEIPDRYDGLIKKWEDNYGSLTRDDQKITMLIQPQRRTQGILYLPQNITYTGITGDFYTTKPFHAPRSDGLTYRFISTGKKKDKKIIHIYWEKQD